MIPKRGILIAPLVISCVAGESSWYSRFLQRRNSPPQILSREPLPGQVIRANPLTLIAEVTDDDKVQRVEFELRDQEGGMYGFFEAEQVPETNEWASDFHFPDSGTWEWRIKADDTFRNNQPVFSEWTTIQVPVTLANTKSPTASFTELPPGITRAPVASHSDEEQAQILADAKEDILNLIGDNPALSAKFLRMAFHDCVGGCDGCIDLENPDNVGLAEPIDALADTVAAVPDNAGISRTDIWALAALTAAEETNTAGLQFPMTWIGRQDCEGGRLEAAKAGPHRELPGPDLTTHKLLEFFDNEFGFNPRQVTALFGAHSIGSLARENSGFDGPNGWDNSNRRLDNNYYRINMGGNSASDPIEELVEDAPNWTQRQVNNNNLQTPNRFQWERNGGNGNGNGGGNNGGNNNGGNNNNDRIVMLNVDISLVRDMEGFMDESTGEVSCQFRRPNNGEPTCPHAAQTLEFAAEYAFDNDLFLNDFRNVFILLLVHGYDTSVTCNAAPCALGVIG